MAGCGPSRRFAPRNQALNSRQLSGRSGNRSLGGLDRRADAFERKPDFEIFLATPRVGTPRFRFRLDPSPCARGPRGNRCSVSFAITPRAPLAQRGRRGRRGAVRQRKAPTHAPAAAR